MRRIAESFLLKSHIDILVNESRIKFFSACLMLKKRRDFNVD